MLPTKDQRHRRGDALILEHCAALDRLARPRCAAPIERLEALLGHDFAHLLVHGLTATGGRRHAA
jgi:hypothetical protein